MRKNVVDARVIRQLFNKNLDDARKKLGKLNFCSKRSPDFQGLSGWVFEQTIQDSLRRELHKLGTKVEIQEQVSLGGRAKADLLVGRIAMEIKARGLFDKSSANRYQKYKVWAKKKDYVYLYLTLEESYQPYREAIFDAVGKENAFFLDRRGDWQRFIKRIEKLL